MIIRRGDRGEKVHLLQRTLNELGFNLVDDGIFGGATESAVKAFQERNSLVRDGIVGKNTIKALGLEVPQASVVAKEILHVERRSPTGTYRLTFPAQTHDADVTTWLWFSDPPEGTAVDQVGVTLGDQKFDVSGVHDEASRSLRPEAFEWLSQSHPERYEDALLRRQAAQEQARQTLDSLVPHFGDRTFREVWENFETFKGLHESDGHFVWIGWDGVESRDGPVIEEYPMAVENQQFNQNVRIFVNEGNSLHKAVRTELDEETIALRLVVLQALVGH
jgi:hypothetical protein